MATDGQESKLDVLKGKLGALNQMHSADDLAISATVFAGMNKRVPDLSDYAWSVESVALKQRRKMGEVARDGGRNAYAVEQDPNPAGRGQALEVRPAMQSVGLNDVHPCQ